MNSIPTHIAQVRLAEILSEVSRSHLPVEIADEDLSGVLVSSEDWRSIQETLHLLSIPGMRESIREGLRIPLDECSETVW